MQLLCSILFFLFVSVCWVNCYIFLLVSFFFTFLFYCLSISFSLSIYIFSIVSLALTYAIDRDLFLILVSNASLVILLFVCLFVFCSLFEHDISCFFLFLTNTHALSLFFSFACKYRLRQNAGSIRSSTHFAIQIGGDFNQRHHKMVRRIYFQFYFQIASRLGHRIVCQLFVI